MNRFGGIDRIFPKLMKQCPGRLLGVVGQDPSYSKSNWSTCYDLSDLSSLICGLLHRFL
jgi:hypothetical protein